MGTVTGTFNFYDKFKLNFSKAILDLDTDALGLILTTSTHTPDSATHEFVSDLTNEVVGNGYARAVLAGVTLTAVGPNGKVKFDFTSPVFTASGGSITARYWHVYSNANGSDATRELIDWGLIDDTPADVVITDGNTLTINPNASGLFTIG